METPKLKRFPIKEFCNNTACKTPRCPFRVTSRTSPGATVGDLSETCDYFSPHGDGRYGKGRIFFDR